MGKRKSEKIIAFYSYDTTITATPEQKQKSIDFCRKMENINQLVPGRRLENNNKRGKTSASGKMAEFAVYSLLSNRIITKLKPGENLEEFISEPSVEIHKRAVFDVDIPTKTRNWHIKVCRGLWDGDYSWFFKKRDPHCSPGFESDKEEWFIFLLERKDLGEGTFQIMWSGQMNFLVKNKMFQETSYKNHHPEQCVVSHKTLISKQEEQ